MPRTTRQHCWKYNPHFQISESHCVATSFALVHSCVPYHSCTQNEHLVGVISQVIWSVENISGCSEISALESRTRSALRDPRAPSRRKSMEFSQKSHTKCRHARSHCQTTRGKVNKGELHDGSGVSSHARWDPLGSPYKTLWTLRTSLAPGPRIARSEPKPRPADGVAQ